MSTIAHELKKPLTALQTAGILLRDSGLSGNEPRGELVDSILDSCSQSLRMITQRMERFSREHRAARTKVEPVDLPDASQQVVEQNHDNALAKGIEIEVSVPDGDPVEVGNGATFWVNLPVEPDRVSSGQDVAEVV